MNTAIILPIAREIITVRDAVIFDNVINESNIDDNIPYLIGLSYSDSKTYEEKITLYYGVKLILHIGPVILIVFSSPMILLDTIFSTDHFHSCELILSESRITIDKYFVICGLFETSACILLVIWNFHFNLHISSFVLEHPVLQLVHYLYTAISFYWWIILGGSIRFSDIDIYCEDGFSLFFSIYLLFHVLIFWYDCFLCFYIYKRWIG